MTVKVADAIFFVECAQGILTTTKLVTQNPPVVRERIFSDENKVVRFNDACRINEHQFVLTTTDAVRELTVDKESLDFIVSEEVKLNVERRG